VSDSTKDLLLAVLFCGWGLFALVWTAGGWMLTQRRRLQASEAIADRVGLAIDDLDRWCSAYSPHARLIASHLAAIRDGHGLNAGTPHDDEPCTVNGLREQLCRLDNQGSTASPRLPAVWSDPNLASWEIGLGQDPEGTLTNAVTLLVRADDLIADDSGEHPGERFAGVNIQRAELRAMLHVLEDDWLDHCRYTGEGARHG